METTAQAVSQGQYLTALLLALLLACAGLAAAVIYLYRELQRLRHPVVAPDPLPFQKAAQDIVVREPKADAALLAAVERLLALETALKEATATNTRVGTVAADSWEKLQTSLGQLVTNAEKALRALREDLRERKRAAAKEGL